MIFDLIRVRQYYKNLLVFLVLIFAGLAFDINSILLTILGFFSLCLISSTNYILNDIVDIEKDKKHPEKCKRPLPAGKISIFLAGIIAGLFAISSLAIAWVISINFFYLVISLFFLTQLYSLYMKNEVFLDVLFIAINFILRAVSGAFILFTDISPWLVVCIFFLALFLAVGKRKGDLLFLGKKAVKHKKIFKFYTESLIDKLLLIVVTLLIASYSFYSFMSVHPLMLFTLPIVFYCVLRYLFLLENNSEIIRKPELFYKDYRLLCSIFLWVFSSIFLIYIFPLLA